MHRVVTSLLLVSALWSTSACLADQGDEGILIEKNVAASTDTTCTFTAMASEPFISHGILDVQLGHSYLFIAQMVSRITAATGQEDQKTDFTTGANIDVTFPDSTFFSAAELADMKTKGVTHFKSLFSAPIAPNDGITDAGFPITNAALTAAIVAKNPGASLALEAVATITVVGDLSGGTVSSQPFAYPLTFVDGGVVENAGMCPLPAGTVVSIGNACNPTQDGVLTCCTDPQSGALTCPATVAAGQ